MFIRRTQTRSSISGEPYVTYRLVQSERVGKAIKQSTVLNLGSHFDLPPAHWSALAHRIETLLHGQGSMLSGTLPEEVQNFAHRFAAQIIARTPAARSMGTPELAESDSNRGRQNHAAWRARDEFAPGIWVRAATFFAESSPLRSATLTCARQ